jgi:hypothetical protein
VQIRGLPDGQRGQALLELDGPAKGFRGIYVQAVDLGNSRIALQLDKLSSRMKRAREHAKGCGGAYHNVCVRPRT